MTLLDPIPSPVEDADFAALEWEPLLALVAGFAASPVGREAILSLRPSIDEDWIARQHQLTGELRLLLNEQVSKRNLARTFCPKIGLIEWKNGC